MILNFNHLKLHNFLSYKDAEISFNDKHFCRITGINNYASDNAENNGIGKSSIGTALCWALTGETIQGIKNNIKNINADDDSCYVELSFKVDNDSYKITRFKSPKSDLKIEINNVDISGKGIKESENILNSRLPDLTRELLASTIILGQGLPLKFSANSPSGRKELLEKLSKSDFMILDLKERINNRETYLQAELRKYEDNILKKNTQLDLNKQQQQQLQKTLEDISEQPNFDIEIADINQNIEKENTLKLQLDNQNTLLLKAQEEITNKLLVASTELNTIKDKETAEFNTFYQQYLQIESDLNAEINQVSKYIADAENVPDICPTCHQKISKPLVSDIDAKKALLEEQKSKLKKLRNNFDYNKHQFEETTRTLAEEYKSKHKDLLNSSETNKAELEDIRSKQVVCNATLQQLNNQKLALELKQNSYKEKLATINETLMELKNSIELLTQEILYNTTQRDNIQSHLAIINQLNTFVKRDFRGFLLNDIIQFIQQRVKNYSRDIFKNDNVDFILNGNNIDITFCGKPFELLSGGEQQRLDIIVQFSIRDMLQEYLNFSSNILFLDEIFDQLDSTAVDAVLSCILNKLCDIESVFIISHRAAELEIPYDSEIFIMKDKNGDSSLTCR